MEITPMQIPCPNCDRLMNRHQKQKRRLYRHSEDQWFCSFTCPNPLCGTMFHLKYSAKSFQISNGVSYNECEY